jgi:hypothetical protein
MKFGAVSCCRALKPAGRPLPLCRGGNGPPSATRRLRGGGAVVDSKNIVCHVNSSACRVYVTYTTSISFFKSFYTFRVFIYFLQLQFRGHFRVHFCISTHTYICGRSATFLLYTYTHLWMYSGLYSVTATFSRPFSCTFSYIHAYIHLWTHSDVSILLPHSSVDVHRSLQCYSYIFAAIFVYIFVHPRLHSSVDAQRCLYSTPALICGCTCGLYSATATFSRPFSCTFVHPRLHSSVDAQ